LFTGWRLRAILMMILCDHYLSNKTPPARAWARKFMHAPVTEGAQLLRIAVRDGGNCFFPFVVASGSWQLRLVQK
jgi:hypothetical protein